MDPALWARELDIPREAVEVYLSCEVIDLQVVSFVWTRVIPRYDLGARHYRRLPRSAFLNQVDLPRVRESQLAGVCWDIPTNPLRRRSRRPAVTRCNVADIAATLARYPEHFALARSADEYHAARTKGLTAGFVGLQGGLALEDSLDDLDAISELVVRITLVELTESRIAVPSNKRRRSHVGLSRFGHEFVARMQANRILVDLSHINRRGFFEVLEATDPSIPMVVTHTGVSGVRPLWRNIDDAQIKAIAERGGTVGIVLHRHYLAAGRTCGLDAVADHIEHVVHTAGEDFVSLGSDLDGMIILPDGFRDVTHLPKLVSVLLNRGWSAEQISKLLGGNFLRVLSAVRPRRCVTR